MLGRTFCPLGDAAAMPTIVFVEKFRDEFEAKLSAVPGSYEDRAGWFNCLRQTKWLIW